MGPWLLLLLPGLHQAPNLAAPPVPAPTVAAPVQPAPLPLLRAQYSWGYAGADGQGKGTFNILLEPAAGRVVLELQGLGERLLLLDGNSATGYHLQVPRQRLDQRAPTLAALPLPFFPQVGSATALYQLLSEGTGPGVKVSKRDRLGPVKLAYRGVDDQGKELMVWLQRTRWEPGQTPAASPAGPAAGGVAPLR